MAPRKAGPFRSDSTERERAVGAALAELVETGRVRASFVRRRIVIERERGLFRRAAPQLRWARRHVVGVDADGRWVQVRAKAIQSLRIETREAPMRTLLALVLVTNDGRSFALVRTSDDITGIATGHLRTLASAAASWMAVAWVEASPGGDPAAAPAREPGRIRKGAVVVGTAVGALRTVAVVLDVAFSVVSWLR